MNQQLISNVSDYDRKTYRRIRRAIGYLGIFLPVLLVCFSMIPFFKTSIQPSISEYYYSNLREIFTGTVCAIGLFFIRYVGYKSSSIWKNDNLLTNIAGYLAIGLAFIPTNPTSWSEKIYTILPYNIEFIGYIHYAFASLLFILLSYISINIFTIGQDTAQNTSESIINENNIYKSCGYFILVFLILTPIFSYLDVFSYSTLTFEALMLFSFGISWLIKGRALGDKGEIGEKLYGEFN